MLPWHFRPQQLWVRWRLLPVRVLCCSYCSTEQQVPSQGPFNNLSAFTKLTSLVALFKSNHVELKIALVSTQTFLEKNIEEFLLPFGLKSHHHNLMIRDPISRHGSWLPTGFLLRVKKISPWHILQLRFQSQTSEGLQAYLGYSFGQ